MVLARRTKLRVCKNFFRGYLFAFVEYLSNRSLKIKTKNIINYSSILAIVNHQNWLDNSPPLSAVITKNDDPKHNNQYDSRNALQNWADMTERASELVKAILAR